MRIQNNILKRENQDGEKIKTVHIKENKNNKINSTFLFQMCFYINVTFPLSTMNDFLSHFALVKDCVAGL